MPGSRAGRAVRERPPPQALLDLARHEDLGVQREVAHTVARLAVDPSCREKILQYGIIPIVIAMCKTEDVDTTTGR